MTICSQVLAAGDGWSIHDVVCTHGPADRPFGEEHTAMAIAAVMEGSFQYRTRAGSALLVPGSLLLGNAGSCFECGHEHARGDRCLAFHFSPACFETIAAGVPGVRGAALRCAGLPPMQALAGVFAAAVRARNEHDGAALEELGVQLAGTVLTVTGGSRPRGRSPSSRDERRITAAVRHIERATGQPLGLSTLARQAAMSPYHFLRTFRQLIGMTPHQYVLHTRLQRAAQRLLAGGDPVSSVALEAGFNDLATFNRRFRRVTGMTPSAFRAREAGRRRS
jgi:AraC family transcriptional regulator